MAENPSADVHRPADLITFLLEIAGKILVGIISLFLAIDYFLKDHFNTSGFLALLSFCVIFVVNMIWKWIGFKIQFLTEKNTNAAEQRYQRFLEDEKIKIEQNSRINHQ